ncbi:uncharacterized protein (DUF58 family) [Thermosporothrix hazakensis]|jgi:uncharacterized protein (DUF58 family)|uniref:Uncharacterized protein (DUF58 family) n=1 Tax=Thermosporothrix hazakensis TaxID=644383 RepID=A0A326TX40_THEHA|nr:DUF58 domain-containing protein [Thermosporothrix hazakensis]PZW21013.1 uncharacterized protein (DUF58 family) [Thermosporothrix hazakensis]GCE49296.1 hypothetical protein KTH_41650 [Thermosporothrix hazakensis]
MRPWQAILLILILAFLAISSGWKVFYVLLYVLLALFLLSWLWARYSLRKLVFRRSGGGGRIQVGEPFDERLMLDNLSIMPKLWVQIVDGSTLPGHRAGYVASIGGRKRAMWRARTICRQRGRFQLGPVSATSGDPFGLFRRRISLASSAELLVLPQVLPITSFALFSGGLPGRGKSSRKALQTTTNATTIREYVSGDSLSRIHWRSSAHYNKLMVKEFDLDPAVDVWIFLDLNEAVQAGEGEHSTEEYGVTLAASIAVYLLRQDLSVGLIVNGEHRENLPLDRGDRQIERVLELLAVVRAGRGPELREMLAVDSFHLGRNTAAIVITPSNSRDWHIGVQQLQRRGVQVAVVGLNAASFDESPEDEDSLALLEGAGVPVLRVKSHDALAQVLEGGPTTRYALRR